MADVCAQCVKLDNNNKQRYGDGYWCKELHKYVSPSSRPCSYFVKMEKPSNNGCFITTVVVDILGYDDDCYILRTLRDFRNKFLQKNPEYQNLLLTYDKIGPIISQNLLQSEIKERISLVVSEYYLIPICHSIQDGDFYTAIRSYVEMVKFLQNQVCVVDYIDGFTYDPSVRPEEKGHGRALVVPIGQN